MKLRTFADMDGTVCNFGMKPRLFVDMDGTLAEFRNIVIKIERDEDATHEEICRRLDAVLYSNHYYYRLAPHKNVVDAVREIIRQGEIEVFVLSCVKPDAYGQSPLRDKNMWLDKTIPEIDRAHRIFVPDGEDKSKYIPGGLRPTDALMDDYTFNLERWVKAITQKIEESEVQNPDVSRAIAIKLLNAINGSKGTWKGNRVSYAASSRQICEDVSSIVLSGGVIQIQQEEPEKHREKISDQDFLKQVEELHDAGIEDYGDDE